MMWSMDPLQELMKVRNEMNRIFSQMPSESTGKFPAANIYETNNEFSFLFEVPGIKKEDISINLNDSTLRISGKRTLSTYGNSNVLRKEQPEGEFERAFHIPVGIKENEIKAKFENGLLTIVLPKSEEARPRTITIES